MISVHCFFAFSISNHIENCFPPNISSVPSVRTDSSKGWVRLASPKQHFPSPSHSTTSTIYIITSRLPTSPQLTEKDGKRQDWGARDWWKLGSGVISPGTNQRQVPWAQNHQILVFFSLQGPFFFLKSDFSAESRCAISRERERERESLLQPKKFQRRKVGGKWRKL